MSDELVNLISRRFIARTDVKARQFERGYTPVREKNPVTGQYDGPNIPWCRADLNAHIAGTQSFGHYLLNQSDQCKLFAFDIDLEKSGLLPGNICYGQDGLTEIDFGSFIEEPNLRDAWHVKAAPPGHPLHDPMIWARREYMKINFMLLAKTLAMTTKDLLDLDVAVAYSGNKGVHVYAFLPGLTEASLAREGALAVLEACDLEPRTPTTDIFYKSTDQNPITGFPNLSVEVYPKQDTISNKDLGNLLRLPLGRNLKWPTDPTFFIDMTEDLTVMKPTDPLRALTPGNDFLAKA